MRIALFAETFLPKWDGVAHTLCRLLDHLAARGHASLMFAPEGAPPRYANTAIVGLPGFAFPLYPDLRMVSPTANVEERLADFRPDLVHLVNPALLGWAGLRHARTLEVPVIASYHTDIPGYAERYGLGMLREPLWAYFRWIHNQADLNLCPSRFTCDELQGRGFRRLAIWGRGVDTVRFSPRQRSETWRLRLSGGQPEAPLLLYVGRLAVEKRVEWLRALLYELPGVRLAIVGDGPLRARLEEQFTETPTVFTGYLRGEDLAQAYASADLFVFPSANETLGNVVLEAMASGLPVVAPRSGGVVDHVVDGENGFLVDKDDVYDMVAAVRTLVADPPLVGRLAAAARQHAERQSWQAILDGLLAHYELLARPAGSGFRFPRGPSLPGPARN
jgi:glycosyltransferase involved in cell wall biosynthesis